jgi:putative membrane protein
MFERTWRLLPTTAAALTAGLIATGSFALAHTGRHSHHVAGSHTACRDTTHHGGRYSEWDEQWLQMSIEGDRFEIQGGKLALQKATTPPVKALADRLIQDHSSSLKDAVALAKSLRIRVPGSPSPTQQWALKAVSVFSGTDFDRWYADLEVKDHMQDIDETSDAGDEGCNDQIRALAREDLPMLQQHEQLAQAALAAAGGPPAR